MTQMSQKGCSPLRVKIWKWWIQNEISQFLFPKLSSYQISKNSNISLMTATSNSQNKYKSRESSHQWTPQTQFF